MSIRLGCIKQYKTDLKGLKRRIEHCARLKEWKGKYSLQGVRLEKRTRCSNASACLWVCVDTCPSPCLTPAHSSQSSPRQQRSLTSTKLLTVFVRRARSACPSITVPREAVVSPENIDDVDEADPRSVVDE